MSLKTFKHLLPNARAWRITVDKTLRNFFEGLSEIQTDVKTYVDLVWLDIFPAKTRFIAEWEDEFNLPDTGLNDADRRTRLDGAWKAVGGQSPRYIQDTLQGQGFDVYVHTWYDPVGIPAVDVKLCVTPRDPFVYLREEFNAPPVPGKGYPLVNKISLIRPEYLAQCGETLSQCDEPIAQCGNYAQVDRGFLNYILPADDAKWPYFLYIGAATFPNLVSIDASRQDEFEAAMLKICPAQQWIGVLAVYIP